MTSGSASTPPTAGDGETALPEPETTGGMALSEAIATRRSVRAFRKTLLTPAQVGSICWSAQGITDSAEGRRAAPSAGALYPMTVYVVDADGVFEYRPKKHALRRVRAGDVRADLRAAALDQSCVDAAPTCLVVAMTVKRSARKYGTWGERYCLIEAGHIAQNALLQATALGLGGVPVGAFDDDRVAAILGLPDGCEPVYMLPLGVPARG
ncbi:MAG: SagB/ThcOx family dehydrogenase [Planctomycetes bacterium]|nr:SagB/ThcOx family dehydrogenase [Planctomycetota bacterium]